MPELLIKNGMQIGKFIDVYGDVLKKRFDLTATERESIQKEIDRARKQEIFSTLKLVVIGDTIQSAWTPPKIID